MTNACFKLPVVAFSFERITNIFRGGKVMKKQVLLVVFTATLLLNTRLLQASEWGGPELVTNGTFSNRLEGWQQWPNYWSSSDGKARFSDYSKYTTGGTLYQMINAQHGKRYRVSGQIQTWDKAQIGIGSSWGFPQINTGLSASGQTETKSAQGIISTSDDIYVSLNVSGTLQVEAFFDNISVRQIVYDPQVSISQNEIRMNSSIPNGSQANINLAFDSLCDYADALTSWSMDWGDGVIESNPTLGVSHSHSYSIVNSNDRSQTWNAVFSGTNQAGIDSEIAAITVLRQPVANLLVNGISLLDGETIEIDIFDESILDLSLLNSSGYLEGASFVIDGLLDQSGLGMWNFSYSGNLFGESDIGQVHSLTAGVYNTGLGVNSDYLDVNLSVVPEPATFSLLGLGAVILRRKRKA